SFRPIEVPILSRLDFAVSNDQNMCCGQFADAFVNRHRRRDVIEREVMPQGIEVKFSVDRRMSKYRLGLGRVDQLAVKNAVVQRLFAKTVTGKDQLFCSRIPQSDREHSVDVLDKRV